MTLPANITVIARC